MYSHRILNDIELSETVKLAQAGDKKSIDLLLQCNVKLCSMIAARRTFRASDREDLVQEAVIGLIEAIDKFDAGRGVKFTTYAQHHIMKRINNYTLNNHSQVKLGTTSDQRKVFWRLSREVKALSNAGQAVTNEALSERLNVPVNTIAEMRVRMASAESSLSAVNPTTGNEMIESLTDDLPSPEVFATERNQTAWLHDQMVTFEQNLKTPVEVATWNFRIASQKKSCQQIADDMGATKQWVNQVEIKLHAKFVRYARAQA